MNRMHISTINKKITALALFLTLGTGCFFAQNAENGVPMEGIEANTSLVDENTADTVLTEDDTGDELYKRNFLVAGGSLFLPNLVIGGWNRFVSQSSWAKVDFDDVIHFYESEWSWDEDWYWTNFVLHPYQGALTYMGVRSANFTPYESILWSTASSLIWEYFFETNSPSINDLVYTSIGAFPLGEMLFRLSYNMQNVWSPLRFVANPMRLFTDPAMRGKTNIPKGNVTELSLRSGIGTEIGKTWAASEYESITELYPAFVSVFMDVVYGDPYENDSNIPYSQFELSFGGILGMPSGYGYKDLEEQLMYEISILSNGMIFARSLETGDNIRTTIGMVFDYDFIWQSFQEVSALSPGFAIKQQILFPSSTLSWQLHLDALLLGTTDFYYYRRGQFDDVLSYRSYSYTVGAETVGNIKWESKNGHILFFDSHTYVMYDLENQISGEMSSGLELFTICQLNYEYNIFRNISLGLGNSIYLKYAAYKDLPSLFASMYKGQVYTRIKIK